MSQQQIHNTSNSLKSSDLVLLTEAEAAVGRYVNSVSTDPNPTYAFLIVQDDILQALGVPPGSVSGLNFTQFRVYFGLNDEEHDFKMRLFVVPVDDSGHDIFPLDSDDRECVYDFNAPCPATCDLASPLYYGRFIK
jgi:hypothetical protein